MEIWNEAKECMSRDQMTQLQSARLKKVVSNVNVSGSESFA